jgi:pantoate--beta-alanine ligase
MNVLRSVDAMRKACRGLKYDGGVLGLVPTMGALHEGHLSLVSRALAECDGVAVSIFVNPMQFGVGEDYDVYPRAFEQDCAELEAAGVHLVFAPSVAGMYPGGLSSLGANTFIEVPQIGERLDGISRPGHFRGVATIVAKLLNITGADRAYFGQKDAAQVAVLQAMVHDLNFGVQIVVCPTIRDRDGLALSSRNRSLDPEDRQPALTLHRAIEAANDLLMAGETNAVALRAAMLDALAADARIKLDYAEVVDPVTLRRLSNASRGALIAVAARVGSTRLIDNRLVEAIAHEAIA